MTSVPQCVAKEGDQSLVTFQSREKLSYISRFFLCNFFKTVLDALGRKLRDNFYLPLNKKVDEERQLNQSLAKKISNILKGLGFSHSKKIETIKQYFNIKDIEIPDASLVSSFKVRIFESKLSVRDKNLRIILFTFNGNTQCEEGTKSVRSWDPLNMHQLSQSSLDVMQFFQQCGMRIDSLITHSLGNIVFDGGADIPVSCIPQTVIINRGFTSSKKVANQLCPFPLNYILYGAAKLCEWTADPEKGLLSFLRKDAGTQRKVVLIEALKDSYLSGRGAPDADLHEKVAKLGASVFRAKFWPYPFQQRAHHAIALNHLVNNSKTQILANSDFFPMEEDEKMSSAIARNIFQKGRDDWHTCFCIGGADSTIEIGTVREVMPLLSAFIKTEEKK